MRWRISPRRLVRLSLLHLLREIPFLPSAPISTLPFHLHGAPHVPRRKLVPTLFNNITTLHHHVPLPRWLLSRKATFAYILNVPFKIKISIIIKTSLIYVHDLKGRKEIQRREREHSDRAFNDKMRSGDLMEAHREAMKKMQRSAK